MQAGLEESQPRRELTIPRFSESYMDKSADPLKDFYSYSIGKWIEANPIPKDKAQWTSFDELYEWNLYALKHILEGSAVAASDDTNDGVDFALCQIGGFYSSAMDTKRIQEASFGPISNLLSRAKEGVQKRGKNLGSTIADLHKAGVRALFSAYSQADKKNSSIYALYLDQDGLSLPDREYYLADSFKQVREAYKKHIQKMFKLANYGEEKSKKFAELILGFETKLASHSRSKADLRDEQKNYNKLSTQELFAKFPALSLQPYLDSLGVPKTVEYVIIGQPEFFTALNELMGDGNIDDVDDDEDGALGAYLQWHVTHSYAPFLHSEVESENFDFFHRTLLGQVEPEARWKLSSRVVDAMMGEALGRLYVEKYFPPEAGRRIAMLIEDISEVFKERLANLPWMTEATKKHALAKFAKFKVKIGHPEHFRDYSSVTIDPIDYVGNIIRSSEFEAKRQCTRVGGPVDKTEWFMTPPTVNAYFSPTENEIVFPAGILQPPFFDVTMDDAINYGGIGSVIGHEITHGYDDQGRKFDGEGNLKDWWTPDDESKFNARAKGVSSLYASQEALPGVHINGELTLGENIADFGGLSLAYAALQKRLEKEPEKRRAIGGLSTEQRFFVSWGQIWRQNIREEELRRLLTVDPHSPCKYRAVLPAVNHPAFDDVFRAASSVPAKGKGTTNMVAVW